jgi:hypothetical protein
MYREDTLLSGGPLQVCTYDQAARQDGWRLGEMVNRLSDMRTAGKYYKLSKASTQCRRTVGSVGGE